MSQTANLEVLTTRAMAAACGVTPDTLRRWSQTKAGFPQPARVTSRTLRWDRTAVLTHIKSLTGMESAGA